MHDKVFYVLVGVLVAGGLVVQFFITRRRHRRDHRADIEPILSAHGLAFVSARWPGMFKVGPFPRFEIISGRPQSRVGGIRGEYDEYRIVTVQDSQGKNHEIWALLEFELFCLRRIRWRGRHADELPPQARGMLEDWTPNNGMQAGARTSRR